MTTITEFGWWHIPAATEIERELFSIQPWGEALFWADLAADDRVLFAAVDESGSLLGYADIAMSAGEAEILNIAVRTGQQGRGIGYALLQAMLEASAKAGAHRVLLEVREGNEVALSLYQRNGFSVVGRRPNYYAVGVHAVLMERHD